MDYLWFIVENTAKTMAAEIADNAIAMLFGMMLDRGANIAEMIARFCLLDTQHQAFIGDINQPLRLDRHITDQKHPAGVAMPAVKDNRNIDIDDITRFQFLLAGYAVADDVID